MKRTPVRATCPMEPLTPQELEELRKMIDDDRMTETEKDDLIRTVDHIVQSFVLAAHGLGGVQLSLSSRANAAFQISEQHATIQNTDRKERVDLGQVAVRGGEIEPQSPNARHRRPEHS